MPEKEEPKLKVKEAADDIRLNLVATPSSDSSSKSGSAAATKTKIKPALKPQRVKKPKTLPFGGLKFFFMLLALIWFVSPWTEICHTATLIPISDLTKYGTLESRLSYADAWTAQPEVALSVNRDIYNTCLATAGKDSVRTAAAAIHYAAVCAWRGHNKEAVELWTKALPILEKSFQVHNAEASEIQAQIPAATTANLIYMARIYENNEDYISAAKIFSAALLLWDLHPGAGTKTNAEADLADIYEHQEDYANAAKYMKMALDVTRVWGNTQYNVFRAAKMSFYNRQMGDLETALDYAKEAVSMSKKGLLSPLDFFVQDAQKQLEESQAAIDKQKSITPVKTVAATQKKSQKINKRTHR